MTDDDRQPWHPEGMPLPQVGNRVRVKLSAECPGHHEPAEDGATGRVLDVFPPTWFGSHHIAVVHRTPTGGYACRYAAAELEVIDPLDGRASDARGGE